MSHLQEIELEVSVLQGKHCKILWEINEDKTQMETNAPPGWNLSRKLEIKACC